ncbi:MAG TPA: transcription antitermination factor NusB [Nitrospirota bacterium]|jgi:transcription antitermination factor NusB
MGSRRKARELALQYLYKLDVTGDEMDPDTAGWFFDEYGGKDEDRDYSLILVQNTCRHSDEIDGIIKGQLEHWSLDRLSAIDRNILRFATCELLYFLDIPVNVTINEAIEIAKKFSLVESATFINGVLDKIAKNTRKGQEK